MQFFNLSQAETVLAIFFSQRLLSCACMCFKVLHKHPTLFTLLLIIDVYPPTSSTPLLQNRRLHQCVRCLLRRSVQQLCSETFFFPLHNLEMSQARVFPKTCQLYSVILDKCFQHFQTNTQSRQKLWVVSHQTIQYSTGLHIQVF